jgi:hypothetical protein
VGSPAAETVKPAEETTTANPTEATPAKATSPTTTEPAANPIVKAPVKPTPAVKGIQISPKGTTAVSIPQRPPAPAPRVPVKVVSDHRQESSDFFVQKAIRENSLLMKTLHQDLEKYERALSRQTESDTKTCAKNMAGLYQLLLRTINNDKTTEEFREQWQYILSKFKECKDGGLGMHRVFRAAQDWPMSHDDYKLYQKLINLIEADLRYDGDRSKLSKVVNFNNFNTTLIKDAGRGRLLSYYH